MADLVRKMQPSVHHFSAVNKLTTFKSPCVLQLHCVPCCDYDNSDKVCVHCLGAMTTAITIDDDRLVIQNTAARTITV